jgi:hypothetical protein
MCRGSLLPEGALETLMHMYRTTLRHMPEDSNLILTSVRTPNSVKVTYLIMFVVTDNFVAVP